MKYSNFKANRAKDKSIDRSLLGQMPNSEMETYIDNLVSQSIAEEEERLVESPPDHGARASKRRASERAGRCQGRDFSRQKENLRKIILNDNYSSVRKGQRVARRAVS